MGIAWIGTERVIDGDTLSLNFSGVEFVFGDVMACRVRGVNCLGLYDRNPQRAFFAKGVRDAVAAWWAGSGSKAVSVVSRDKYFRWDVDVTKGGDSLAAWLIRNGLGEPYEVESSPIEDPTDPPLNDSFTGTGSYIHLVTVHRVVDGDTFIADTDETEPLTRDRLPIRIHLIDAPSLTDPDPVEQARAVACRDRLEEILGAAAVIKVVFPIRDKYFRMRSRLIVDGASVGRTLYDEGLADKEFPWMPDGNL